MRNVTLDQSQALAFVDALTKSPKAKAYLQACLGYDGVPDVKDFLVSNPDSCQRAEELLSHLQRTVELLRDVHRSRPRQTEVRFEPEEGPRLEYPRGGIKEVPAKVRGRRSPKPRADIYGKDES